MNTAREKQSVRRVHWALYAALAMCIVLLLVTAFLTIIYTGNRTTVGFYSGVIGIIRWEDDLMTRNEIVEKSGNFPKRSGWVVVPRSKLDSMTWAPMTKRRTGCYYGFRSAEVQAPLWIPVLCLFVAIGLSALRNKQPIQGHCRNCKYDLTGNSSGICPECGTPLEHAEEAATQE